MVISVKRVTLLNISEPYENETSQQNQVNKKKKKRQKTRLNLSILQISLQFVWALSLFYMSLFIFIVQHKSPNGTKHCCQQEDNRLRPFADVEKEDKEEKMGDLTLS